MTTVFTVGSLLSDFLISFLVSFTGYHPIALSSHGRTSTSVESVEYARVLDNYALLDNDVHDLFKLGKFL